MTTNQIRAYTIIGNFMVYSIELFLELVLWYIPHRSRTMIPTNDFVHIAGSVPIPQPEEATFFVQTIELSPEITLWFKLLKIARAPYKSII